MDEESPNIEGLSFEDKIAFLEEDLPKPIQDFLHSPDRDAISLRLSQKYSLHADQAGAFEQAYLYMLLGVNTPDEFVQDLKDAGISADAVRGLTSDINEQVFKKLQREELNPSIIPLATRESPTPVGVPVMQVFAPAHEPQVAATVNSNFSNVRTMQSDIKMVQENVPKESLVQETMPSVSTNPTISSAPATQIPVSPIKEYAVDPYHETF